MTQETRANSQTRGYTGYIVGWGLALAVLTAVLVWKVLT
jgi:hypothetical protein